MKHVDITSSPNLSKSGWRILGELELPIGAEADSVVSAWLTQILNPLNLHTDFLNKVLKSAQDAAARAMQVDNLMKFRHIHLLAFAPADVTSMGETWGFFRIEKVGSSLGRENPFEHSIEFYLYLEG